jgi:leucyl/phenylalanyl-tRNA--protein transferase
MLDPDVIIAAYRSAYFPMADSRTRIISWYSPDPRAIIPLDAFRVSRSLQQIVRKQVFEIRVDTSFSDVIQCCARREETWISEEIISAYATLHARGVAHSVESWKQGELVGGLYGVSIGGAFFGESMFSTTSNASKVALVHLAEILRGCGFRLLDTQCINEHVKQFGAIEIPRSTYLEKLSDALHLQADFSVQA